MKFKLLKIVLYNRETCHRCGSSDVGFDGYCLRCHNIRIEENM